MGSPFDEIFYKCCEEASKPTTTTTTTTTTTMLPTAAKLLKSLADSPDETDSTGKD